MFDDVCKEAEKEAEQRMQKTLESLKKAFAKVRTGRAHPSLLTDITVSYYGSDVPLHQIANINVQDTRTLTIMSFDKSAIPHIEKAIISANLGLNPVTVGELIRVPLPLLTEERRKELVKIAKVEAEKAKVAVRNIRRDTKQTFKQLLKEKEIAEDASHSADAVIQILTDEHISKVDCLVAEKEKAVMAI